MDPPQDPPPAHPAGVEPMMAKLTDALRRGCGLGFEVQVDGIRAMAHVDGES